MSQQTAADNDFLFRSTRHRQETHAATGSAPRQRQEATRSWWMEADCRQAFTDAADREQRRMQRGPGAKWARGIIVGNFRSVTGGK